MDNVTFHRETIVHAAPGSDLWPCTWASDDNIYVAWGDGGGFGGTNSNGRVSMGFARISGPPTPFTATNVNGGKNCEHPASFPNMGKTAGMLSVDGTLYSWLNTQDAAWPNVAFRLIWSSDLGATWTMSRWSFPAGEGNFKPCNFVNFGKDYAGARDGYVYMTGGDQDGDGFVKRSMARVPKTDIKDKTKYEYFAGFDGNRDPLWDSDITHRKPLEIPLGIVYDAPLKRYVAPICDHSLNYLGIADAPQPWGPWTCSPLRHDPLGAGSGWDYLMLGGIANKWTSADGLTMWLILSYYGKKGNPFHDSFTLVKITLKKKLTDSIAIKSHSG